MRGPSSSHCAAALRIGRMARDLMAGSLDDVMVTFDVHGSLATTHHSQGSDMGLMGGLLGWEATDERLADVRSHIHLAGIRVRIAIDDFQATHPNTYRMVLQNREEMHALTAISTGGGMIEIQEIDGVSLSLGGDYYETLIWCQAKGSEIASRLKGLVDADAIVAARGQDAEIVEIKGQGFLDEAIISTLYQEFEILGHKFINPVLPVLSRRGLQVPFTNCADMLAYNRDKGLSLWELAVHYEAARGNLSEKEVLGNMSDLVNTLQHSIAGGIQGTQYKDRILGAQSKQFQTRWNEGALLEGGMLNRMILYVSALMEMKSSMGVIVAAPTAGSCGGLPGAVIAAALDLGRSDEELVQAMLAAGLIGVFIASRATFAAEVGGCQAECGSGSGMAAAALVTLARGTLQQAIDAASMALQNILGMVCDPVANRVEVPCLGKNVLAAGNALSCANMALAGYDVVIPLDEVIETMNRVGRSLPHELRCTALGGLSTTQTSLEIGRKLQEGPE